MAIFSYIPLIFLVIAFMDYKVSIPLFENQSVGLKHFKAFLTDDRFWRSVVNTLGISALKITIGFVVPIIFALLLNEVKNPKFKKVVQSLSYMPHFISWVVFGGIVITLLSSDGPINNFLVNTGIFKNPVVFMAQPKKFWEIAIISNLIKELGWSTILYTAAIAGVDQELYEAAEIDGAGRFRRMISITIPCIKGTVMIMVIFAVAGILNNNFDQIYVLQNSFNLERSEVIDTYIYKIGIQQLQFGMAAAVNITKSFFSLALLLLANGIVSKLSDGYGLF